MIISCGMAHVVLFSFCSQCGAQIRSDNAFCGQCGTPVPAFNPQSNTRSSERHRPRNSWFSVILFVIALWIYLSPYVAVWNLKEAVRTGDIAALNKGIDFPAFRTSLKEALNRQLAQESSHGVSGEDAGFAALGSAFAATLMGGFIDQIATPQGVANFFQGKKTVLDDADFLVFWSGTKDVSIGYESFDRFDVRILEPKNKVPIFDLIWRRSELINWRFSEVRMPD
jgi:predicted nucleic acid-binding Zn ribbon protein